MPHRMSQRLSKSTSPLGAAEREIRARNVAHGPPDFAHSASTAAESGVLKHRADFAEEDGDDNEHESERLLSSSAGDGHLPFDGIEHLDRRRSLDRSSWLSRWLPGLAAVWAATTPELVAISLGARMFKVASFACACSPLLLRDSCTFVEFLFLSSRADGCYDHTS